MHRHYDIAAFVWPAYTGDEPRTEIFWPEGIGEWQTVSNAQSKFSSHNWPRKPLWGYPNEANPDIMNMQIEVASSHGVNVFIYDWYWYDKRPFLENCLNDGYLKATNNNKVKFYLMWANHSLNYILDKRNSHIKNSDIWDGKVNRSEFEILANRIIEKYFFHPSYYCIDGKPVFMFYDIENLIEGLGGVKATREALEWFKNASAKASLPGVHLQLVIKNGINNFTGFDNISKYSLSKICNILGFDSVTNYQFCHIVDIDRDYSEILKDVENYWYKIKNDYVIPYFPHVSVGWDSNPRYKEFIPGIIRNNTPQNVREAFIKAKQFVDKHTDRPPLITVNSWNEWTETSYLQPDDLYGYGYLQAIKDVFINKITQSNL